jgi:hypothetical protein
MFLLIVLVIPRVDEFHTVITKVLWTTVPCVAFRAPQCRKAGVSYTDPYIVSKFRLVMITFK